MSSDNSIKLHNQLLSSFTLASVSDQKDEGKDAIVLKTSIPPLPVSNLKALRSVFQSGKTYRFRMTRIAVLSASGAGLMNLVTKVVPSDYQEYSALSLIFTEARLRSTKITYTMLAPSGGPQTLYSAFDPSVLAGGTTTVTQTTSVPGCKAFSVWCTSRQDKNSWSPKTLRPFSLISSSGTGSDPMGGVEGAWYHSLHAAVAASVAVANYMIECDYEFRSVI